MWLDKRLWKVML